MQHPHPQHPHQTLRAVITPKRCLIAACAFFALMVAMGAIPGEATALSAKVPDKLLHFTAYAGLSGLIYDGLAGGKTSRALRTLLLIALLGGLDEAIQSFMPYRSADLADWAFDMLAALSSVLLLRLLHIVSTAKTKQRTYSTVGCHQPHTGIDEA